jgi:hypothetical protein
MLDADEPIGMLDGMWAKRYLQGEPDPSFFRELGGMIDDRASHDLSSVPTDINREGCLCVGEHHDERGSAVALVTTIQPLGAQMDSWPVSSPWPGALSFALGHGPGVAFAVAFGISPGAHAFLAAVLERRRLRPRDEFTAVVVGDPLLAAACACGVAASSEGPATAIRPLMGTDWLLTCAGLWIGFGLYQWRKELRSGYYNRSQAWAPTKIWHQVVVYPLLGVIVTAAGVSGMAAPTRGEPIGAVLEKVAIALCFAVWCAANVYDRFNAKLGHPPYAWRSLRPLPSPWPTDSVTLVSHYNRQSGKRRSGKRQRARNARL